MGIRTGSWLGIAVLTACLTAAGGVRAASTVNYLVLPERSEPFQIVRDGKSEGGIVSDIVKAVFAGSPYSVRIRVLPINRLQFSVRKGLIHNWILYDAKPWPFLNQQETLIDEPLFRAHHIVLSCRDHLPPMSTILDLRGLQLAVLKHFDYLALDKADRAGIAHEVRVGDYISGIRLVELGRVDGFVEMSSRLRYHLAHWKGELPPCLHAVDFSAIIPDYNIYLAVDRQMPKREQAFVKQRVRALRKDGTVMRILQRYLGLQAAEETALSDKP